MADNRPLSACKALRLRRRFLSQWVTLLDMVNELERECRGLPDGVFTHDERWSIASSLEDMWNVLINERPTLLPDGAVETRSLNPLTALAVRQRIAAGTPVIERPAVLMVHRAVRDLRAIDPTGFINVARIHAACEQERGEFVGYSTVCHALTALDRIGYLRKSSESGWSPVAES